MSQSDEDVDAIAAAAAAAIPLPALTSNAERYAPILDAIGDAQFVCLGECTHGTKEFYKHRAAITKLLIEQKGFSVMLVEGDWPAGWRLDRYISAAESTDTSAEQALGGFEGFPRWMWRNSIIANLAEELRARNERLKTSNSEASEARDTIDAMRSAGATDDQLREMGFTTEQLNAPPVGFDDGTGSPASFYGMDTYSVSASAKAVIEFLEIVDPEAASVARARYATLEGFGDEMKKYGMAVVMGELKDKAIEIQEQIASVLADLQRQNRESYDLILGPAELLNAEQNAQVVVNGEAYFREMWQEHAGGGTNTWNLRDQHMVQTCLRLVEFHRMLNDGRPPKVVLWAHNSHVGDASATNRAAGEEWNLGQMMRTTFGEENTFLVGFGTYSGTVTAAKEWGGEAQTWDLSEAEAGSYSDLLHQALPIVRDRLGREHANLNDFMLLLRRLCASGNDDGEADEKRLALTKAFGQFRRQRAIGVRYQKEREGLVHYVQASLGSQFDAWIHCDVTSALVPL